MSDTPPPDAPRPKRKPRDPAATKRNEAERLLIMKRRELVGRLEARGLTQREIVAHLATEFVNPETKKPFDLATINRDLRAINAERIMWLRASRRRKRARLYGKIIEAQRLAWKDGDVRGVLAGIKAEAELLGTNEPIKTDNTHKWEDAARAAGHDPAEVRRKIAAVLDAEEASDDRD